MAFFTRLVGGLRALIGGKRAERELDAELREYLDAAVEQKISTGMSRREAERAARVEMGSLEAVKDQVRDVGWESRLEALWQDLRYAVRMVRCAPALATVVVVTIAIGVGAATSMFSIMRNLLLAPPHVSDPDRVFRLHQVFPKDDGSDSIFAGTSYPFYELVAARAASLDAVGAYNSEDLAVGTGPDARMAHAAMVSAGFWKTLGPRPALGRFIQDDEAHPATGARIVVLGHAFWRRHFGGSANAIGTKLRIKGQPYEIIGVAPRGFRGIGLADIDLWLPMFAAADGSRNSGWHKAGTSFHLMLVARLKEDATPAQASAELSTLYSSFMLEAYGPGFYPDPTGKPRSVTGTVARVSCWVRQRGDWERISVNCRKRVSPSGWWASHSCCWASPAPMLPDSCCCGPSRGAARSPCGSRSVPAAAGSHVNCSRKARSSRYLVVSPRV